MSLIIKITKNSISDDGLKFLVKDTTGDYDATTNISGYGTPNAFRASLALIAVAVNKRYDASDDITDVLLPVDTYDPLTAAEWLFTINKSGWQQVTVYGMKLYSPGNLLTVGEVAYDSSNATFKRIESRTGTGPYTFTYTLVTQAQLSDPANFIPYVTVLNTLVMPAIAYCSYKINKQFNLGGHTVEDRKKYIEFSALSNGVINDFNLESYSEAQKTVEVLEGICSCFTENCDC